MVSLSNHEGFNTAAHPSTSSEWGSVSPGHLIPRPHCEQQSHAAIHTGPHTP